MIWGVPELQLDLYACDPMLARQDNTVPSTIGGSMGMWGFERLIPSDLKVDDYSEVPVRWALGSRWFVCPR